LNNIIKFSYTKNIINQSLKIIDVIEILDIIEIKLALIVDDNNKLVGTITDGDVRRALLKKINTDDECRTIMNISPIYANESDDHTHVYNLLKKNRIAIPIVDKNKKITSLTHLGELNKTTKNNIVFIMAGGRGERLMPLTIDTPKPLLPINNKPIIKQIIDNIKKYRFNNIHISVNYKSEKLINYLGNGKDQDLTFTYINEDKALGTAGALSLLKDIPDRPIIVINGDILTGINLEQLLYYHNSSGKKITMCAANHKVPVPYGTIEVDGTTITEIEEKPLKTYLVNAGIYVIEPIIISKMKKNIKIDMTEIINNYVSKQEVSIYPLHEQWIDIGSHEDYEKAQK